MQIGNLALIAALVVSVASVLAYLLHRSGLGRGLYVVSAAIVVGASTYFLGLILGNHFEFEYIALNSSSSLPLYYKVSAFWAGQEGSFLLWALCGAVLGLLLLKRTGEFEPKLIAFWGIIQSFLLIMLIMDSPFLLSKDSLIADLASAAASGGLSDGIGLREILQNPWMAIHPPVVFLGYAALCIPAGFVFAAALGCDVKSWCRAALPWTVFGWVVMGAGIILGAYWAYEELGWGGYWAWDPVENASLVPWILATALVHGMLAERHRGSFRRANIVLVLLTVISVFYATFLTRSDVLAKASVHSFGGSKASLPLIVFLCVLIAASIFVIVRSWKRMEIAPAFTEPVSKDYAFVVGAVLLTVSALVITFGTSVPIFGSNVAPSFYNQTNAPIILMLLALIAVVPFLAWKRGQIIESRFGLGVIVIAVAAGIPLVSQKIPPSLMNVVAVKIAVIAVVALISSTYAAIRQGRSGFRLVGGFVAHAGISLMFIGVVLSTSGGPSKTLKLVLDDKPTSIHGYNLTYTGISELEDHKYALNLDLDYGGKTVTVSPTMQETRNGEVLKRPLILQRFTHDLYIAPNYISGIEDKVLESGGDPVPVQDFELRFVGFERVRGKTDSKDVLGARLEANVNGRKVSVIPVFMPSEVLGSPVQIPSMQAELRIDRIIADERAVELTLKDKDGAIPGLVIKKGETISAGRYKLLFKEWTFPQSQHSAGMTVGAVVEVTSGGKSATVEPVFDAGGSQTLNQVPIPIPNTDTTVEVADVDVQRGLVQLTITPVTDMVVLDVSVKPYMSLLWIGSVLALLGGCIAVWRRIRDTKPQEGTK